MILGLYPLLQEGLVDRKGIVADCKTGVSGGGRGPTLGFHYPEVEGGVRPYGLPKHRHNPEMDQELSLAAGDVLQTTVQIPIPHKGSYEIVVRAEGTGPTGPVVTEGMVRIDFGVPSTTFVERDGVAEFEVKGGRP